MSSRRIVESRDALASAELRVGSRTKLMGRGRKVDGDFGESAQPRICFCRRAPSRPMPGVAAHHWLVTAVPPDEFNLAWIAHPTPCPTIPAGTARTRVSHNT